MKGVKEKRFLAVTLLLSAIITFGYHGSVLAGVIDDVSSLEYQREIEYDKYIKAYATAPTPRREIILPAARYRETDMKIDILNNFEGFEGQAITTEETGYVEWEFNLDQPGLYNIALKYYPLEGRGSNIIRGLVINGETPFSNVKYIDFYRIWHNADSVKRDNRGNEIAPFQEEIPAWIEVDIKDSLGYYPEPFQFYFEKGKNTVRLLSHRDPMVIGYLKIHQAKKIPSYEEVSKEYEVFGYQKAKETLIKKQAEETIAKSTPTIYPIMDLSDPLVEPYHYREIRLNTIGGQRWQHPGEWIEWEIEAPETGLYKIGLKVKQNLARGVFSSRRLYIDGETPFQEVAAIPFEFSNRFQMRVLGDDRGTPYLFHLSKGKHRIRLEVTLGETAEIVRRTEENLYQVNDVFRQILMVTSATPDPYRDYQLETRIPEVLENLRRQGEILKKTADELYILTGERAGQVALLSEISRQFIDMAEHPKTIKKRIKHFRDNLGALGAWLLAAKEQPLTLDYLALAAPEAKIPMDKAGFFRMFAHEMKKYVASYFVDYKMVGDIYDKSESGREPLKVWMAAGRDQAQILKRMIEDSFTPQTGIFVNLELVNIGTLLPATLAGRGPDIALGMEASAPMNFALRQAVVDLTQFPDFNEVKGRFHQSALAPFTFRDHVYALPQQQVFLMMFYRKDILYELGLGLPQTWEDVLKIIPELQKHNMNFGLPVSLLAQKQTTSADIGMSTAEAGSLTAHPGVMPFLAFLYQRGGDLYLPDGVKTSLDKEEAVEAFQLWTDLYELYKLPLEFNSANRFRTGEMPLLIENYPLYSMLKVFAPEIRGKWGFTLMPGTLREDGTIDRTIPTGVMVQRVGSADMILKDAKDQEAAWEFLKWWNNVETQVRYGRELESMMGVAARFPTANTEAASLLPWTVEEFGAMKEQWEHIKGVPEVPGGYMTGRHLDNAFRKVVNDKVEARKTLLDYVRIINEEIELKRKEFGLETEVEAVLEKYNNKELEVWW